MQNIKRHFAILLLSAGILGAEIGLMRIFSVTMWYHFAFLSISIVMFGLAIGALVVQLYPSFFPAESADRRAAQAANAFSLFLAIGLLTHLAIPIIDTHLSLPGITGLFVSYLFLALPFISAGIAITLTLTKHEKQAGYLYASDLVGAALGCLIISYLLGKVSGPTAILIISLSGCISSALYLRSARGSLMPSIPWTFIVILGLSIGNESLSRNGSPLIPIPWIKGSASPVIIDEVWTPHSRVTVEHHEHGRGIGLSNSYSGSFPDRLMLQLDSAAGTEIINFKGNVQEVEFLKFDITNLAHHLRSDAKVLVVGVGGARDIVSALAFGQKSVVGLEMNSGVLRLLGTKYNDFSGNLTALPNVQLIHDEARSFASRSKEEYDLIHMSLVDTWAATQAGAYALTENNLYTLEAFKLFLSRLSPTGIFSISRWYRESNPYESHRLLALAVEALKSLGSKNSRASLILAVSDHKLEANPVAEIATLLISPTPFTSEDIAKSTDLIREKGFRLLVNPEYSANPVLDEIANTGKGGEFYAQAAVDISPPTDDKPFFFHMLKVTDIFSKDGDFGDLNFRASQVLLSSFAVMLVLVILFIYIPLRWHSKSMPHHFPRALGCFFSCIGCAFMLIELSQFQRLIILLGHPFYALIALLFPILLGAGAGSYISQNFLSPSRKTVLVLSGVVVIGLLSTNWITLAAQSILSSSEQSVRVAFASVLMTLLGCLLGIMFPLGMKLSERIGVQSVTAWIWGLNGAFSVLATVIATAVSLAFGITVTYFIGIAVYLLAFISLAMAIPANED